MRKVWLTTMSHVTRCSRTPTTLTTLDRSAPSKEVTSMSYRARSNFQPWATSQDICLRCEPQACFPVPSVVLRSVRLARYLKIGETVHK